MPALRELLQHGVSLQGLLKPLDDATGYSSRATGHVVDRVSKLLTHGAELGGLSAAQWGQLVRVLTWTGAHVGAGPAPAELLGKWESEGDSGKQAVGQRFWVEERALLDRGGSGSSHDAVIAEVVCETAGGSGKGSS